LPVDVLREMGVTRVIAVNVIPTPDHIRSGLAKERARRNGDGARKPMCKVRPLDQKLNYFAPGNLFEILVRSIQGAQIRVAEASCRMADVVLRPAISDDSWLDYRHPGNFIALGRKSAEQHLDEIKALVNRKEVSEEVSPVAAVA
jgi:predicted acylesterase/phospholipase RssA